MNTNNTAIILALSNMLISKTIDTTIVQNSLKLICDNFAFDTGLIYEIDQYNILNVQEHHTTLTTSIPPNFPIAEIAEEHRAQLASENLVYIYQSEHNTQLQSALLNTFQAQSLALTAMVDETNRVSGFIVFSSLNPTHRLDNAEIDILTNLLSMLDKYVGTRIYHNKLAFARTSLESILDNTGIDIYVNDLYTHEILYVNRSMAAPYGGPDKFINAGKCWQVLFPGQQGPCDFCPQEHLIDDQGNPTTVYTWDYQRPFDGAWFRVFSAAFRWIDGRTAHVVSSANITDNKRNEELVEYLANYDSLTNLPNRRMLISECEHRINNAQPEEKGFVLFFDIDGFKAINDEFGHDAGDEFLIKLGEFFTSIPLLKNAIYRNGGDEFVAILSGFISESNVYSLANFIHQRFKYPWILKKGNVYCNVSIGVSSYPQDGRTANELLQKADQAMYKIKKSGGAGIYFASDIKN